MDYTYENLNSFQPYIPEVIIPDDLTFSEIFPLISKTILEIFKLIYPEDFIRDISEISYKYFEEKLIEKEGDNYKKKLYKKFLSMVFYKLWNFKK